MSGAAGNLARRDPEPPPAGAQGGAGGVSGASVELAAQALSRGDPYLALAAHPAAAGRRPELTALILASAGDRRRFASAPYTPESVLHALAQDADSRIRARVARHPATAPHTLAWLLREHGGPQLQLLTAAHPRATPALLSQLPWRASPDLRPALCANPKTPPKMLAALLEDATPGERKAIARNPAADAGVLSRLWRDSRDHAHIRAEAAAHAALPDALLQEAARDARSLVRRKAARNPGADRDTLLRLLQDANAGVRAAAAYRAAALSRDPAAADALTLDPSRRVRRAAAGSGDFGAEIFLRLARDRDTWVRRWTARNPAVPQRALEMLAGDDETEVRRGVARNPACPEALLSRLARDAAPWVRAGAALRPDLPLPLIRELARERDADILSPLGRNPAAPADILLSIVHHGDKDVRRSVIFNESAPPEVLRALLEDPYPLNRALLARREELREEDLQNLLADPEPQVRFAAAQALLRRAGGASSPP